MSRSLFPSLHRATRAAVLSAGALALVACTTPDEFNVAQGGVFDPHEAHNREAHELNKKIDRGVLRPVARTYDALLPNGVEDSISHFSNNLSVPGAIINQVLQGNPGDATRNLVRFGINSTFGFAGLADVATDWGIPEKDADFGQTLAVWGVPQGAYVELPLLGPSTERAAAGKVVDYVINPLRGLESPEADIATGTRIAAGLGSRARFGSTIDSVLYESADSYAATRDIYLQNRSFELEQIGVESAEQEDPYADIFGE